ncbi:MAG TPA: hypothetical protein VF701_11205 [Thermoanaerobaculia bacterium]
MFITRRSLLSIPLILLVIGCASSPAPVEQAHVIVERDAASRWTAVWHLAAPERELRFERFANGFRAGTFEVLTPGYRFETVDETEVLRTAGVPSRTIAVRFPVHTEKPVKEYAFFQQFTDGSVSIYSGHLLARVHRAGEKDCASCLVRDFVFVPPTGASVLADGKRSPSAIRWTDTAGQGTYVYFGSIEPVETGEMISIIDPGLPPWLEKTARESLPRLFAHYHDRLGVSLPRRPTVLFNYVASDQRGFSNAGGTLPGLIQLGAEGRAWANESPEAFLRIFRFLAHEAVHLWNGEIINYPDMADSWMHEGGADALAERAMLALGLIDEAAFLELQSAALNDCRRGLGSEPLRTAYKRSEFSLYYPCGNAIALVTEAALRTERSDHDLFSFWRQLIAHAMATSDRKYHPVDYIDVWRKMGADEASIAALRRIVEEVVTPDELAATLTQHGVEITHPETPPASFGQQAVRAAALHLLVDRCRGRLGFRTMPEGLVINDPIDCEQLRAGDVVTAIGDHDVLRAGHLAADHLVARCGSGEAASVTVRRGGALQHLEVPCAKPLAPVPAYVRIESRP